MSDWLAIGALFVLDLLSKPVFWVCLCLLWGATIVANSIQRATEILGRRLELLTGRFRKRSGEDEDDEFFDDL